MAPTRIAIEPLVQQHGVQGLADKVGVHPRTVGRWRNDGVEPSPLAKEKLKEIGAMQSENKATGTPAKIPMGARDKLKQILSADQGKSTGPQRQPVQLPTSGGVP